MILKRLREKSNQKYFNNLLREDRPTVPSGKIDSVGILLNSEEFNSLDRMRAMLKAIGFKDNKVKFITFISDESSRPNSWDSFFSPKDFGWKGKLKNVDLEEFINTRFDALICYYNSDIFELNLVTALSQASFKIGITDHDPRLFDLIIRIKSKHVDVFQNEIVKYLTVLNKI